MAIRKEDWATINDAINSEIRKAVEPLRPTGWKKALSVMREYSILGTTASVIVALAALAGTQFNSANQRVKEQAKFEQKTTDTLDALAVKITEISGQLARINVSTQASLPVSEFRAVLPAVGSSLATLSSQKIAVPESSLATLAEKITASGTSANGFWPVAAEFISYRSQLSKHFQLSTLRQCTKQDFVRMVLGATDVHTIAVAPTVMVRGCTIVLDSQEVQGWIGPNLAIGGVRFDNCVIFYNGGPLLFPPVRFIANGPATPASGPISFTDCLFLLTVPDNPPPSGRKLTATLLATTESTVRFEVGGAT